MIFQHGIHSNAKSDQHFMKYAAEPMKGSPLHPAVSWESQWVLEGLTYQVLTCDYDKILSDGMLLDNEESFDVPIVWRADIQISANLH